MISLHFHWAWILIAMLIIAGVLLCHKLSKDSDPVGFGAAVGCCVLVVAILLALVVGGIFIW